jgi:hypothetical protein
MLRSTVRWPFCFGVKIHLEPKVWFLLLSVAVLLMWGFLSDERTALSFTIAAAPRQRSYSWVRVPWDSWLYIAVSDSRLPQPGEQGSRIYIPQEEGGPVIPPGSVFYFRCLLRLAGLRWRYSTPPPHENDCILIWVSCYIAYQYSRKRLLNTGIHGNACWTPVSTETSVEHRYPRKRLLNTGIHGNACWTPVSTETSSWFPRIHLYGNVFVRPFPSNGSACHNACICEQRRRWFWRARGTTCGPRTMKFWKTSLVSFEYIINSATYSKGITL